MRYRLEGLGGGGWRLECHSRQLWSSVGRKGSLREKTRKYMTSFLGVKASVNGTSPALVPKDEDFVDMAIADMSLNQTSSEPKFLRVPNPRKNLPNLVVSTRTETEGHDTAPGSAAEVLPSTARALKIENAWSASELKLLNRELAKAKLDVSARDKEIAELKRQMASRDQQLRYTKAELIESRQLLQKKDDQLRTTYESLVSSACERSKLREELITVEQELMEARDELNHWTSTLVDLKTEIDSIDEEENDIEFDDILSEEDVPNTEKVGLLESFLGKKESPQEAPRSTTSAVDLLKDLQDLSEQLLEDARNDENTLSIIDE